MNKFSTKIINAADMPALIKALELPNTPQLKIGIIGGRFAGSLLRALSPSCPNAYLIDKSASVNTKTIIGIGGNGSLNKALKAAEKLNARLFLIPTTPFAPSTEFISSVTPAAVIALRDAVCECPSSLVADAFCTLASMPLKITDKRIAATLYGDFFSPEIRDKALFVIADALKNLENNEYGVKNAALIISEASLKLYALGLMCGNWHGVCDNLDTLLPIKQNLCLKKFLFSLVLTRFYLSRLADPLKTFTPPPYCNARLYDFSRLSGIPETALMRDFNQKDVDFKTLSPRLDEYSEDFIDFLREVDGVNLRCLKILKRLRFDCGASMTGALSPTEAQLGVAYGCERKGKSLLRALRDRGELEAFCYPI